MTAWHGRFLLLCVVKGEAATKRNLTLFIIYRIVKSPIGESLNFAFKKPYGIQGVWMTLLLRPIRDESLKRLIQILIRKSYFSLLFCTNP